MSAITQDQMEAAIHFLASTDEECAALRSDVERAEWKAKATEAAMFTRLAGTVAERQAAARSSDEVAAAQDAYFAKLHEYETLKNQRATKAIVIDAWRSLNANRRQG